MKVTNNEFTPKSQIFVKFKAEEIFKPQLTLVNEDLKISDNVEVGKKILFKGGSNNINWWWLFSKHRCWKW